MSNAINAGFTDFNGLKEAFKKAVESRFAPGWVWLGLTKDNKLMVLQSNNQIEIMAGSGVNASNAKELSELAVDALHFTSHKSNLGKEQLGMGNKTIPDPLKTQAIISALTNE